MTDGTAVASEGFTWDLTSAISLAPVATQTNAEGASVSLSLSATDANSLSLTWGQSGLPTGLTLNATSGLIYGTIGAGAANAGPAFPEITVTDGTDIVSEELHRWDLTLCHFPGADRHADQWRRRPACFPCRCRQRTPTACP